MVTSQPKVKLSNKLIVPGVYAISLPTPFGSVNSFLIKSDGLTLIDTGLSGSAEMILQVVREIGRLPTDIQHILVTHCHADHTGSLAVLKQTIGASAYMHPLDAAMVREGRSRRSMLPLPGIASGILFRFFTQIRPLPRTIMATAIEHEVHDGDELPIAGGIRAIHAPGHCAGQLVFLWTQQGGILFAGDAAANVNNLGLNLGNENLVEARQSLVKIASLDFETVCFGHGDAIVCHGADRFRQKWGTQ